MSKIEDHIRANMEKRIQEVLNDSGMLAANRKTLSEYLTSKGSNSLHTKEFYAYRLRELSAFCQNPFIKLKKADIRAFMDTKKELKQRTRNGYIATLKAFYRWLYKMPRHQFPDCVAWMEKSKPEPAIKSRHELPTLDEFKELLNATSDPRIKCYLTMSLEGIYRKDELRRMRIKDLIIKEKYVLAYSYEQKTHSPNIKPLVFSKPYITAWLNAHPFKDDVESPLFVPMRPPIKKFLAVNVFNSWLRRIQPRTGITKRLTPHRFRHTRTALMVLSGKDRKLVKSLGGWTTYQMMDNTYAHVEKEDNANAILSTYGIEVDGDGARDVQVSKCMVCNHPTSELDDYCPNCKSPPSLEQAEKEQEKLLTHQRDEKEDIKVLQKRMDGLEHYVKRKLVEEIVRAVIEKKEG